MKKWWALVAICLGTFMLLVDATIVNIALPDIAQNLHSSFVAFQWVVNVYALPLAALLLAGGALADRYGRRKLFLIALATFAVASLICGLAASTEMLIVGRAVQGVGGAVMYATTAALIVTNYRGKDVATAFAVWAAVNGLSAACGPILGGVLTEYVSWRAIFLINVPVAIVATILALRHVAESRNPAAGRLDVAGILTFTVGVGAVTYALTNSSEYGWADTGTVTLLIVGAAALLLFLLVESRTAQPMLDLGVFRSGSFVALMLGILIMQGVAFGRLPYLIVWLESALGLSPITAAFAGSVPMSVAVLVVAIATGKILPKIPARVSIGGGLALIAIGLFTQISLTAESSGWSVVLGLVIAGVGVGVINPVLTAAAVAALPPQQAGAAGGLVNTFRQLGFAVATALFGTLFAHAVADSLVGSGRFDPATANGILQGGGVGATAGTDHELARIVRGAFASGLNEIHLVGAVAAALAVVVTFLLVRSARHRTADTAPGAPAPNATAQPD